MLKEQAMLVNIQSHLYEGKRQNMRVTKHNVDQTFWIFYLLCVFGFLTQKQVKIDKKNIYIYSKQEKKINTNFSKHDRTITKKIVKHCHNI